MNYRNSLFDIKISAIGGKKFVNFDRVPRRSLIFKSEEYPIILVNRVLPFEELTCKTKGTFSSSLISFFFFFFTEYETDRILFSSRDPCCF